MVLFSSFLGAEAPHAGLQTGDHGLVEAIGWSGSWRADYSFDKDGKTITLIGGMKETHLLLHPGEKIKTPRIVLMSWTGGDWQQAQNRWRWPNASFVGRNSLLCARWSG